MFDVCIVDSVRKELNSKGYKPAEIVSEVRRMLENGVTASTSIRYDSSLTLKCWITKNNNGSIKVQIHSI